MASSMMALVYKLDVSLLAKVVALKLADDANSHTQVDYSTAGLAESCLLNENDVQTAIEELVTKKYMMQMPSDKKNLNDKEPWCKAQLCFSATEIRGRHG